MLLFLNMFEHLKAAIEERVGLGYSKEEILAELKKAGYEGGDIDKYVGTFFREPAKIEFEKKAPPSPAVEEKSNVIDSDKNKNSQNEVEGGNDEAVNKSNFSAETEKDKEVEEVVDDTTKDKVYYSGFDKQQVNTSSETPLPTPPSPPAPPLPPTPSKNETSSSEKVDSGTSSLNTRQTQDLDIKSVKENWKKTEDEKKKASKAKIIVGALVFALLLSLATVGFFVFSNNIVIGGAPYQNVPELFSGIYNDDLKNAKSVATENHASLAIGPKEEGVPAALPEFFAGLEDSAPFGSDHSFSEKPFITNINLSSKIDQKNKDELKADVKVAFDFSIDEIKMKAEGSLIMIGKKVFGRIDKMPPPMEGELRGVPKNTWFIITEDSTQILDLVQGATRFNSVEELAEGVQIFVKENENMKEYLSLIAKAIVASPTKDGRQLAQVAEFLDTLSPEDREVAEKIIEKVHQAWVDYPFLTLRNEPTKISEGGETVYNYPLKIDEDNLIKFITEVDEIFYEEMGIGGMFAYTMEEIDIIKYINTFNEVVKVSINVRPNGTIYSNKIDIAFASGEGVDDYQVKFTWDNSYHSFGKDFGIVAPTEVHPKTLEEIMRGDVFVRESMSNLRSQAEIFYNANNFSYLGMCSDAKAAQLLDSAKKYGPASTVTYCNAEDQKWAAAAKLNNSDIETGAELFFCVDSTGRATTTSKILYSGLSCE